MRAAALIAGAAASKLMNPSEMNHDSLVQMFNSWKASADTEHHVGSDSDMFMNYVQDLRAAHELSIQFPDVEFGQNSLSGMTEEQRLSIMTTNLGLPTIAASSSTGVSEPFNPKVHTEYPPAWESRLSSVQGGRCSFPVKRQKCGDCWAHASASEMDIVNCVATGTKIITSPQHFLDCNAYGGTCQGGHPYAAMIMASRHKVCPESSYPYKNGVVGKCAQTQLCGGAKDASNFAVVDAIDYSVNPAISTETALMGHLKKFGAVTAALAVKPMTAFWAKYKGGLITKQKCLQASGGKPGAKQDHLVVLIGWKWDEATKKTYFLLRNSHGADWGVGGHMWIELGACGLGTMMASVPFGSSDDMKAAVKTRGWAPAKNKLEAAGLDAEADDDALVMEYIPIFDSEEEAEERI